MTTLLDLPTSDIRVVLSAMDQTLLHTGTYPELIQTLSTYRLRELISDSLPNIMKDHDAMRVVAYSMLHQPHIIDVGEPLVAAMVDAMRSDRTPIINTIARSGRNKLLSAFFTFLSQQATICSWMRQRIIAYADRPTVLQCLKENYSVARVCPVAEAVMANYRWENTTTTPDHDRLVEYIACMTEKHPSLWLYAPTLSALIGNFLDLECDDQILETVMPAKRACTRQ